MREIKLTGPSDLLIYISSSTVGKYCCQNSTFTTLSETRVFLVIDVWAMSPHEEKVSSKKGMKHLLKRRNTLTTLLGIYARRDSQDCNHIIPC